MEGSSERPPGAVLTDHNPEQKQSRGDRFRSAPASLHPLEDVALAGKAQKRNPAKGSQRSLSIMILIIERVSNARFWDRRSAMRLFSRGADHPYGAQPFAAPSHCAGACLNAGRLHASPPRPPHLTSVGPRSGDPARLVYRRGAFWSFSSAFSYGVPWNQNRPSVSPSCLMTSPGRPMA